MVVVRTRAVRDAGAGARGPWPEAGSAALGEHLRVGTVEPRLRLEHLVDALRVVGVLVLGETALVLMRLLRQLGQTVEPVLVVAPDALDVQLVLPQIEAVATERALTRRMRLTPERAGAAGRASVAHEPARRCLPGWSPKKRRGRRRFYARKFAELV